MIEEWRDIKGYEGYYQVSNLGRVRSIDRRVWYRGRKIFINKKGRVLKPYPTRKGYLMVDIFCGTLESNKTKAVHILVWETFKGERNPKLQIDHIDNNKQNNKLSNLQEISQHRNKGKSPKERTAIKKSQYTGVFWHSQCNKWAAQIGYKNKGVHLGVFAKEYDAHLAYQTALNKIEAGMM